MGVFRYADRPALQISQEESTFGQTPWMTRCIANGSRRSLFSVP
jgi:hypothetical protein